MEDPSNPMNDRELEAADKDLFSLIDGSELDDLFGSMSEPRFMENKANLVDGGANMLERPDVEVSSKKEKYNLRKSLAWDSAFFTSAGVLDAEELSSIMEGSNGGKHQMQRLSGIQEDISKSTDSLSTLESDTLTLESLEVDLFSDIRASIQRSSGSTKLRKSNLNGAREETNQLGKRTTDIKPGNMVKPKPTPKKLNANLQGDGKLTKLGPSREQVRKPVAIRRESSSSLPKSIAASGKGSSITMAPAKVPMKRMSISAGRIKSDTNNVGNEAGPVTIVSKGSQLRDSRSVIPKAASHPKSSSGSSATTRKGICSTRSSTDSTSSSSSQNSRILPLNGLQGKTNRPVSIPPPGVKSRIPSRGQLKGKHPPNATRISANSAASMLSPSVSPTSSISEWSSSSSAVTANHDHNVSKDCSSLHRTVSLDSIASQDLQIQPNQQASCENVIEVAGIGNGSVSNKVAAKPSGLRMPSPKIGFFDGVKSGGRTQNAVGSMQCGSRLSSNRLSRSATGNSSPGGVSNKGRNGHTTIKATALAAASANPDAQRRNARIATGGGRLEGKSIAPGKDSNAENNSPTAKLLVGKLPAPGKDSNAENHSPTAKLPLGEKQHSESGSSSKKNGGLVSPSKNATPEGMSHCPGNQVSSIVESDHHPMGINGDSKVLNPHLLHELINEDAVTTELHPVSGLEEVDNVSQVDENADIAVLNEGHEATNNEKSDPICVVVADQQSTFVEQQVNELIVNVDTVDNTRELCDGMDVHFEEVDHNESEVEENAVLNEGHEATNNEKNDPICAEVTYQQSAFVEQQVDELIANVEAVGDTRELCNGMDVNFEEVDNNATAVDEKADTAVLNGGQEATNDDKSDPICVVVTDQQSTFVERQVNELIANVEAVDNTRELCDGMDVHLEEVDHNESEVDENADTLVLNVGHEATSNEKNEPICAEVIYQQSAFVEQHVDELIADVEAVGDTKELCNGMDVNFEEVDNNATEVDEKADTAVLNGGQEATNDEKSDPICVVVTDQQSTFVEWQVNELIANVEAVDNKGELCDKMDINFEGVDNNASKVDENANTGTLNGGHEATNNEKNDPICVVATYHQSAFVEQQVNELVANVEAMENKRYLRDELDVHFEEVDNSASTVDENADTMALNGEHEATNNEKNDPICGVAPYQQRVFVEQQVNELVANVEAMENKRDLHDEVDVHFEEVDNNASKVDENADTMVRNGENEATNHEKNDPICVVATDQQTASIEQEVNELIATVEVVGNKRELCDERDENFELRSDVNVVSDPQLQAVSCTVEISGLKQKGEAANLHKPTDLSVSSKTLESIPGSRTPFADKNSSPDAYDMETLLKSFTSLSLSNLQAKDVEA